LPPETREKILWRNAVRIFNLKVPEAGVLKAA
jgi:predicted TIM-barrel fold metal-dependent hydrolase